ncbi:MAG TPA: MFS transporter [Haloplasmataceae bacterium]
MKLLKFLYLLTFLVHLGDHIIIPLLPILLTINKNLAFSQVGFILGLGALAFQIGSLSGGFLSDIIGRKIILFIGGAIEIFSLVGYGLSNSYILFIIFEVLLNIGGGLISPTIKAGISSIAQTTNTDETKAFSKRGVAAHLGVAIGGLIPIIVISNHFPTFFIIAACVYAVFFLLLIFVPIKGKTKHKHISNNKNYLRILHDKPFIIFSIITLFIWAIYAQLNLLLPLRAAYILKNKKTIGSIFSIMSLSIVLLQTLITKLFLRKFNTYTSLCIGTISMGLALFLMGLSNSYIFLVGSTIVFAIGVMFNTPSIDSEISKMVKEGLDGTYYSISNIIFGVGSALGNFMGGQLVSIYGIDNFTFWLFIFLFSLFIFLLIIISKKYMLRNI